MQDEITEASEQLKNANFFDNRNWFNVTFAELGSIYTNPSRLRRKNDWCLLIEIFMQDDIRGIWTEYSFKKTNILFDNGNAG